MGDLDAALEALEQATALAPNSPEAYFALGQVHIQLGNVTEARDALERVLALNPAPRWREQAEALLESLGSP
jgi:predicted TPR repeat methyltransferase